MTYKTRGDLFIAAGESIKMQEDAGIVPLCKYAGCIQCIEDLKLIISSYEYEFPLFVLEGMPVFKDDVIWFNGYACPSAARKVKIVRVLDDRMCKYVAEDGGMFSIDGLSWKKPKTKTMMVEMSYDDVVTGSRFQCQLQSMGDSFRKALKEIENEQ